MSFQGFGQCPNTLWSTFKWIHDDDDDDVDDDEDYSLKYQINKEAPDVW